MSEIQHLFAKNLKETRKRKKLKQSDVSEKAGLIASTYSRIETCQVSPNLTTIVSLAKALEVTIADLFDTGELSALTIIQKLRKVDQLSEYNQNVLEVMIDTVIEKDRLEKDSEIKLQKRLAELEELKKK